MTDVGVELLAEAIILCACEDIIKCTEYDKDFKSAKNFLLSERFKMFTNIDGKWLYKKLLQEKDSKYLNIIRSIKNLDE